jgi:hypothetical protein
MKSLIRNVWLTIGLAACIGGFTPSSFGNVAPVGGASETSPNSDNIGPTNSGPTVAGLDGNLRLLFYVLDATGANVTSANLWIVAPGGNLLAVTPSLPVAGAFSIYSAVLVQGQADGNTTVAFLIPNFAATPDQLNVWTFNSTGQLIATAVLGPFTGFQIEDADWNQSTGKLLVKWSTTTTPRSYSTWTVNEFGGIDTAFGPTPAFTGTILTKAVLLKNGNQDLVWDTTNAGPPITHTTGLWVVDVNSRLIAAGAAGPF